MDIEKIVAEWNKDSKIDDTELGTESSRIPMVHNKYLKFYMGERIQLIKLKANHKKIEKTLLEYYLGELDRHELQELGREQFFKKLLKNEVSTYIESDDMFIESTIKVAMQDEIVSYLNSIIKSLNNRGFQIKSALDWMKFTTGA